MKAIYSNAEIIEGLPTEVTPTAQAESILQEMGLSGNEARIYLSLLEEGKALVSTISKSTGIHRRNVYDSLNRLIEKGLVFQLHSKRESIYQAVRPSRCSIC